MFIPCLAAEARRSSVAFQLSDLGASLIALKNNDKFDSLSVSSNQVFVMNILMYV